MSVKSASQYFFACSNIVFILSPLSGNNISLDLNKLPVTSTLNKSIFLPLIVNSSFQCSS
jgi:hypothetical protein